MATNVELVRRAALWGVMIVSTISSWYPFTLDPPKRIGNTAVQLQDGTWILDGGSRVVAFPPKSVDVLITQGFGVSVEALPASPDQTGPARLFSIGRNPYDPSLMVGIDGADIVLYLHCKGSTSSDNAVWRLPRPATPNVSFSLWLEQGAPGGPAVRVGEGPRVRLDNRCPEGSSPSAPDSVQPWTLGNVYSGHRPFAGRILRLEMDDGRRRIDLLRLMQWQAPSTHWIWPERLYQPLTRPSDELLITLWHFSSFALLGYLAVASGSKSRTLRLLVALFAFAAVLNGGKLFITGRHATFVDLAINFLGAVTGVYIKRKLSKR